jgi:hypothetical protein
MRKVEDLLNLFLDRIGQAEGKPYVGLFRGWGGIVGERIAAHAEPVDVRGTALVVEADHPGWVQMVMMSRERILREVNKRFPELTITSLHIRVAGDRAAAAGHDRAAAAADARGAGSGVYPAPGSNGSPSTDGSAERARSEPPPPSADEKEALTRIADEELRETLERLRGELDTGKDTET